MKTSFSAILLALSLQAFTVDVNADDSITVEGLITPRDDTGLYVRNGDGQFEIEWTNDTRVCLLYTSDAADDTPCVDLGGRRIIKKPG